MPGLLRAFWVGLSVSLGLPVVVLLLAHVASLAVLISARIVPQLIYAFPAYFFVPPQLLVFALWGSVAQMCLLSTAFAFLAHRRRLGSQWILAIAGFGAWWLICRLLLGVAGLEPTWQPRM